MGFLNGGSYGFLAMAKNVYEPMDGENQTYSQSSLFSPLIFGVFGRNSAFLPG
jgi:hypothetical protein